MNKIIKIKFKKQKNNILKIRKIKKKRIRNKKIIPNKFNPRLVIFKSNRYLNLQIINNKNHTIYYSTTRHISKKSVNHIIITKWVQKIKIDFENIKNNKENEIQICNFDRNCFLFQGKVKLLANLLKKEKIIN